MPARLKYTGIIGGNMTLEEMIDIVKDIRITTEIQEMWLEENALLQQG